MRDEAPHCQRLLLASDNPSPGPVDLPESPVYPSLWALGPGAEVAHSLPLEGAANEEGQDEAPAPSPAGGAGSPDRWQREEAKACDFIEVSGQLPQGLRPEGQDQPVLRIICLDFVLILP